jgi:hypothetical protein
MLHILAVMDTQPNTGDKCYRELNIHPDEEKEKEEIQIRQMGGISVSVLVVISF